MGGRQSRVVLRCHGARGDRCGRGRVQHHLFHPDRPRCLPRASRRACSRPALHGLGRPHAGPADAGQAAKEQISPQAGMGRIATGGGDGGQRPGRRPVRREQGPGCGRRRLRLLPAARRGGGDDRLRGLRLDRGRGAQEARLAQADDAAGDGRRALAGLVPIPSFPAIRASPPRSSSRSSCRTRSSLWRWCGTAFDSAKSTRPI